LALPQKSSEIHPDSPLAGVACPDPLAGFPPSNQVSYEFLTGTACQGYLNYQYCLIGVASDGYFYCMPFQEVRQQKFDTLESLQAHFKTAHCPFNSIEPAHRFMCSRCQAENDFLDTNCLYCGSFGTLQIWIYGAVRDSEYEIYVQNKANWNQPPSILLQPSNNQNSQEVLATPALSPQN
jgi:hypothetical protein